MSFKKKFFKNIFSLAAYSYASQAINFLASIVLSRLLLPEEYGYVALIEGMIQRFKMEFNVSEITVIGTGGLIGRITPYTKAINHVEPWLTLTGLRVIFEMNKGLL